MTKDTFRFLVVVPIIVATLSPCAGLAAQDVGEQDAAPSEAQPRFDVWEYRVLGNTRLPATTIETVVYPFLGPDKTIADVESVRQSLEKVYRDAGFGTAFVDIPEQNTEGGVVRLQVTEGRLDRVRITGSRYFSNGQIRTALPELEKGEVLHLPTLQAQLTTLNSVTSDRAVTPVLKAGRVPGTVDLELKVADQLPVHGSVEINDRYSADTSRWRVNATLSYDNLFQQQHRLSLQYQTAPEEPDDVRSIVGSYVFRVPGWNDMTFVAYAVDSETDVAALGTMSVIGNGNIFGLRAIRTLPQSSSYFHNVQLGVDYKDFLEDIRLEEEAGLTTPIHYFNWSVAYSGTLRGERSTSGFNVSANLGLRGVVNAPDEFGEKRYKGAPNYFYLRAGAEQLRDFPWNMQILGRLSGQFSESALVSNEQFALGGVDTVRGYPESTQLGDMGANMTLELRNTWLSQLLQSPTGSAYVMAFFDAGTVAVVDRLPSQTTRFDLASWGLGVHVTGWQGMDLAVDWAHAFKESGAVDVGDDRAHFMFRYAF